MAKTKRYCVQFMYRVEDDAKGLGMLIEQLRYAGLLTVVKETDFTENAEGLTPSYGVNGVYKLHPPCNVDQAVWAKQNAERMQSFGINAVAMEAR